jgi:hypothetical protein
MAAQVEYGAYDTHAEGSLIVGDRSLSDDSMLDRFVQFAEYGSVLW